MFLALDVSHVWEISIDHASQFEEEEQDQNVYHLCAHFQCVRV